MRSRMQVSRCCCTPAPVSGCDSFTTGYDDQFNTLQETGVSGGGWAWSVPLGVTPRIQPAGFLFLDYDPSMVGTPANFVRCAVWSSTFARLKYRMAGQWVAGSANTESDYGVMTGATVALVLPQIFSLQHRIVWQTGVGWRHGLALFPDTSDEVVNLVGNVIQPNRFPIPVGPFAFDLTMDLSRDPTGLWVATTYWYNNTVIPALPVATPQHPGGEFSHGFALGFSVLQASIDRWTYTPELR